MDFSNEPYVRLYTRNTTTWRRLEWQGQCVMMQLLRVVDRAGVLDIEDMTPAEAVSLHTGLPADVAEHGMARMLDLGVCVHNGGALLFPRYLDAQESNKSDRQRQRESREKRRATAAEPVVTKSDSESQNVTESHGLSHAVTLSHTLSQPVTLTSALPLHCSTSAVQGSADPAPACEARPIVRVQPPASNDKATHTRIWKAYAKLLGLDPLQLGTPKYEACRDIEAAVTVEAGTNHGPKFDAALQRLLGAWRADPWVQEKNPRLTHLAGNLGAYAPGVKPVSAAPRLDARTQREQLEELRDRVKQAHIRVNRMANAPWFDKESPGFPERERNAAAELAAANAALREATSAAKMAVAS
jgi:hypothetical protein